MNNNERDTHFQGFAHLLYEDFLQLAREDESSINEMLDPNYSENWRLKVEQLIAQRAYDLAWEIYNLAPVTEYEWRMSEIPDFTEWPKPPASVRLHRLPGCP